MNTEVSAVQLRKRAGVPVQRQRDFTQSRLHGTQLVAVPLDGNAPVYLVGLFRQTGAAGQIPDLAQFGPRRMDGQIGPGQAGSCNQCPLHAKDVHAQAAGDTLESHAGVVVCHLAIDLERNGRQLHRGQRLEDSQIRSLPVNLQVCLLEAGRVAQQTVSLQKSLPYLDLDPLKSDAVLFPDKLAAQLKVAGG